MITNFTKFVIADHVSMYTQYSTTLYSSKGWAGTSRKIGAMYSTIQYSTVPLYRTTGLACPRGHSRERKNTRSCAGMTSKHGTVRLATTCQLTRPASVLPARYTTRHLVRDTHINTHASVSSNEVFCVLCCTNYLSYMFNCIALLQHDPRMGDQVPLRSKSGRWRTLTLFPTGKRCFCTVNGETLRKKLRSPALSFLPAAGPKLHHTTVHFSTVLYSSR